MTMATAWKMWSATPRMAMAPWAKPSLGPATMGASLTWPSSRLRRSMGAVRSHFAARAAGKAFPTAWKRRSHGQFVFKKSRAKCPDSRTCSPTNAILDTPSSDIRRLVVMATYAAMRPTGTIGPAPRDADTRTASSHLAVCGQMGRAATNRPGTTVVWLGAISGTFQATIRVTSASNFIRQIGRARLDATMHQTDRFPTACGMIRVVTAFHAEMGRR
mmetsp:Transcript_120727/g.341407  ORF Transcript_120727/g.341407 Transcript_120727/m.341407 type:complete len:217 (+) Transcript_120727:523-1173(+)